MQLAPNYSKARESKGRLVIHASAFMRVPQDQSLDVIERSLHLRLLLSLGCLQSLDSRAQLLTNIAGETRHLHLNLIEIGCKGGFVSLPRSLSLLAGLVRWDST